MNSFDSPSPADALRLRFEAFIEALCRCVAAEGAKHRIAGPLVVLIWTRLRRLGTRFARLAANPGAKNRKRRRKAQKSGKSDRCKNLPRGVAWLPRLMPATAASAGQLRAFLADPGLPTLVGSDPRYGRILRPLCRTLGLKLPDFLRLPKTPGSKKRRKRKRGGAKRPKWVARLIMPGLLDLPGHPPDYLSRRRTRAPPRLA